MSKYFLVYLTLAFFATSLAVADESHHGSEPISESGREPATEVGSSEFRQEVDVSYGVDLIQGLNSAEVGLGLKKNTGETMAEQP